MGRKELIDRIAERFDGNREAAQHALDSVVEGITRSLAAGEKVVVRGLGVFDRRKSGDSKSNRDAEPTFDPTQELKDVVAGARKARSRVLGSLSMVPAQAAAAAETAGRAASAAARAAADVVRGEDAPEDAVTPSPTETRSAGDNAATAPPQPAAATSGAATPSAQTPAKKVPAKKAPAKETPAKKEPRKKAPAKKSTAKQAPAKKAPAKKTTGGSDQNATSS